MNIGPTSVGPADDAGLAACLLAVDPDGLGGISLRSAYGPAVERFLGLLRALLPAGTPVRKMPIQIPESRLLGGLDLAATLHAGRPVFAAGLLADADGGCIVIPMAERLPSSAAAILATALDTKDLTIERDGFARRTAMRFGVVALDEGCASDERPPAALLDRLALHLDLSALHTVPFDAPYDRDRIDAARRSAAEQSIDEAVIAALCETAMAFGIHSARAPWFATRVARLHAALAGRKSVGNDDAIVACRLVLAPRATRLPAFDSGETPAKQDEPEPHDDNVPAAQPNNEDGQTARAEAREQGELLVEATRAAIPPELLASMREHKMTQLAQSGSGRAGAVGKSTRRGRPIGARRGELSAGARLNVVETLRAAAPWQALRRNGNKSGCDRIFVRRDDFRISRFKQNSETATIFVVDASGSSALHRLAEAKGAVELLLADCYVRRDQVALIAFRGSNAELLLPPTRSLARAKRALAGLPGGGGTPLAAGIDSAFVLAEGLQRKGLTPTVVLLTDGRGNVARDGQGGRERAEADAINAARNFKMRRLPALLLDISPARGPSAEKIAGEMGARYVPLPRADATDISRIVRAGTTPSNRGEASAKIDNRN